MWFEKVKGYYNSGAWTASMVADAVSKGKISSQEYETITGQKYSGSSSNLSLEDRVSALEKTIPVMAEAVNNLSEMDSAYIEGVNSI